VRTALGLGLIVAAAAVILGAWWLNQPGFAGDPRVKLLDDGPFAVVLVASVAVALAGVTVILRRR
jgi:hypothetical protein